MESKKVITFRMSAKDLALIERERERLEALHGVEVTRTYALKAMLARASAATDGADLAA